MRLRKLVVHNVRGLRELSLAADDKSVVLVGPNGSGKSSVVDAIDFLLTGSVQRLQGVGAGSLSLAVHGKHVDAHAKDASVEATFLIEEPEGHKAPVVVRRTMKPAHIEPEPLPPSIAAVFDRATQLRHHLLSRREILRFIMARPGDRREQVAALLDIESVEEQRKELSGAVKDAGALATAAADRVERARRELFQAVDPPASDGTDLLRKLNQLRAALGAAPLAINVSPIDGIQSFEAVERQHPLRLLEATLQRLNAREVRDALDTHVQTYVDDIKRVAAEGGAHADAEQRLIDAGRELIDGDRCPLCRSQVSAATLRAQLDERRADVDRIATELARLRAERWRLANAHTAIATDLREVADGLASVPSAKALVDIAASFKTPTLPEPTQTDAAFDAMTLSKFGEQLSTLVAAALEETKHLPKPSAKATAWVALQAAARKLAEVEGAENARDRASALSKFLTAAEATFLSARDELLNAIYADIATRVEVLYAAVHGDGARKTSLTGTRTGLEIEVDFHGRGHFPPSALHSEGQQDTLGICLFLALAERASDGTPPLLVLDDVLMSIDAEHRRATARMLKDEFPATQFIITTHDEVWARQLKGLGVVAKVVPFSGWTIEHGHEPLDTGDAFKRMRNDLSADRVPTAAHTLRHTLESTLSDVCEAIGARIRFRKDQQHELGDFYGQSRSKFGDLMKEGIKARQSWNQDTSTLQKMSDDFRTAADLLEKETWAVNKAVHYNEWLQMNAHDFGPVVDAYERFLRFFSCATCGGLIEADEEFVRCPCAETTWPLKRKEK